MRVRGQNDQKCAYVLNGWPPMHLMFPELRNASVCENLLLLVMYYVVVSPLICVVIFHEWVFIN